MSEESGGGGSSWEQEADRTTSDQSQGARSGAAGTPRNADRNQDSDDAGTGMSVGAGMGGFNSYNSAGPITTSMDDSGTGEGDGGGDRVTADQGSTGGRSAGSV
jgi:hypothetical protein